MIIDFRVWTKLYGSNTIGLGCLGCLNRVLASRTSCSWMLNYRDYEGFKGEEGVALICIICVQDCFMRVSSELYGHGEWSWYRCLCRLGYGIDLWKYHLVVWPWRMELLWVSLWLGVWDVIRIWMVVPGHDILNLNILRICITIFGSIWYDVVRITLKHHGDSPKLLELTPSNSWDI